MFDELADQARTLIGATLRMRPGEALAIVSDGSGSRPLMHALGEAARAAGADPALVVYPALASRPLKEYCWFGGRSLKPPLALPPIVKGALERADAALLLIADMELMMSPDVRELRGRVGMLPYLDDAGARRLLPTTDAQVEALRAATLGYAERLAAARHARVTSPAGTDVTMALGEFRVRPHQGVPADGALQVLPAGQVALVPDDGSAEGTVVIDRTIADDDYRELHEPIRLRVRAGEVVAIEGGVQARRLDAFLASLEDARAYHLTELAFGTNPLCRQTGVNAPTEDTHAAGVVSFALGCDSHIGGRTPGPVHIDMTMHQATLSLDDATTPVVDGRLRPAAAVAS